MSQTRTLRERTEDGRTASSQPGLPAPKHALYKQYMLNPSAKFPRRRVDRTMRFVISERPIWDTENLQYKYCAGGDKYFLEAEIVSVEELEHSKKAAEEKKKKQSAKRKAEAEEEHKEKLLKSKRRRAEDPLLVLKNENTALKKALDGAKKEAREQASRLQEMKRARDKAMKRIHTLERQINAEETSSSSSSSSSEDENEEAKEHKKLIRNLKTKLNAEKKKCAKANETATRLKVELRALKENNKTLIQQVKDLRKKKTYEQMEANRLALMKQEQKNKVRLEVEHLKLQQRQQKLSNVKKEAYHAGKYGKTSQNFHNRDKNQAYNQRIGRSRKLSTVRDMVPPINASGQYTPPQRRGFEPRVIDVDQDEDSAGGGLRPQSAPTANLHAALQPLVSLLQSLQPEQQQHSGQQRSSQQRSRQPSSRQQRSQQQHSTLYNYADGNEDNYLDLDSDLEDFESSP